MASQSNEVGRKLVTLPEHLILDHILPRLPAKSLLRFKVVCRSWLHVVSCSKFAKSHLNFCTPLNKHENLLVLYRQKEVIAEWEHGEYDGGTDSGTENSVFQKDQYIVLLYDICSRNHNRDWNVLLCNNIRSSGVLGLLKLELKSKYNHLTPSMNEVGSCNGLVCFFSRRCIGDFLYIWNPTTHQYRRIRICTDKFLLPVYGFGYASSVDDYIITEFFGGIAANIRFRVFSLKTSNWKYIPCCLTMFGDQPLEICRPELVKNTLYWLLRVGEEWYVVRFDLDTQQFVQNPWPVTNLQPVSRKPCFLRKANRLSILCFEAQKSVIWTMTKTGDMNSWEKVNFVEADWCHCTPKTEKFEPLSCLVHRLSTSNHEAIEGTQRDFEVCQFSGLREGDHVNTLISPFGDKD